MHLTCTNMPEAQLENALDKVRIFSEIGIDSISALLMQPAFLVSMRA